MSAKIQTTSPKAAQALKELEQAVARDLSILNYPAREWIYPRQTKDGKKVLDVLVIGAGQGGLAAAFGLMREKVTNILVIDENAEKQEGPWLTFARMLTLRTPKHVTGPDQGISNLSVRTWYEAQFGAAAWDELVFLPKELWAEYLYWFRTILKIPVENDTKAGAIEWLESEKCFAVPVNKKGAQRIIYARKVVLATGIDGSGRWEMPDYVCNKLNKDFYAHTRDDIKFQNLLGKKVAVLGAGASAFDNAAVALETGAKEVHLFYRREELPAINSYRWAEFVGFLKHHADLSDQQKWRFITKFIRMGQLPPSDTFDRVRRFENFFLHNKSSWSDLQCVGDKAVLTTHEGKFEFDFLIIGTGFVTDLSLRPELQKIHQHIALWSDRYTPPESERSQDLERHPYLGSHFEFQEKIPGKAPYLNSIFNYTFGCLPSLGLGGASISGMKYSLQKLTYGITKQFYLDDSELYYQSLQQFDLKEFVLE